MVDKYGPKDWQAGTRLTIGGGGGEAFIAGVSLMDPATGATVGAGSISAVNSSTTPLGIGAVFTGTSVSTLNSGAVIVNVISDVASATNGLSVQQSSDGTNWDITDTYTVAAGLATKVVIPAQAAFARVVYTNGGTIQASFRLQTRLSPYMPTASAVKPTDGMTNENDFPEVLSFGMAWNGTSWDRVKAAPYQTAQTPLITSAANAANSIGVATMTGTATTTVYMAGFEITGSGATAGLPVVVTVAGLLGGTRTYIYTFAIGATVGNTPLIVTFNPPLPASAVNTPIVVTCPASGVGGLNNCIVAHGFYQ